MTTWLTGGSQRLFTQLALWESQCIGTPTFSHRPSKPTPMKNQSSFGPQPFSAAATRLLPPNLNFPCSTHSRLQNPTTLLSLSPSSWMMSVIGKAIQMPRMHSLLVPVRCKRDGAGILKGRGSRHCSMSTRGYRGQTNFVQCGGRRVTIDR